MVGFYPLKPLRPAVTHPEAITTQAFEKPLEADYPDIAPTPDYSFQHVLQPERFTIRKLPEQERLNIAKKELEGFLEQRLLIHEEQPAAYVYYQCVGSQTYTGIVGGLDWKAYQEGTIKQHEKTHPAKKSSLSRFFEEVGINGTPLLMAHPESKVLEAIKAEVKQTVRLYNFTTKDGTQHIVWRVTDPDKIAELSKAFENIKALYIADGHHRCATLSAYAQAKAEKGLTPHSLMSYCLPAGELNIHGYHRLLHTFPYEDGQQFLQKASELFVIETIDEPTLPGREGELTVFIQGQWYRWTVRAKAYETYQLFEKLDVHILDQQVLKEMLGINVEESDSNLRFVEGTMRMDAMLRKAREEGCEAIFLLHPISVETLMGIADAGETLPPKSTWIEPKLRSGLFVQPNL